VTDAFVVLVLMWAVLLVPGALRRSRNSSPHATVGGFERAMDVLRDNRAATARQLLVPGDAGRIVQRAVDPTPHPVALHRPEDPVVVQRRTWFVRAVAATGISLLLAVVVGGWLWLPATLLLLSTGGYVALLRQLKLQRDEARKVVADLDLHRPSRPVAVDAGHSWGASGGVRLRRWEA